MGMMRIQQMHVAAWLRQHEHDAQDEPEAVKVPAAKPKRETAPKKAAKKKQSKK